MANNGNKYPNSGTLGRNERMRPDRQDPEYSGRCNIDGVDYWISAWIKEGPTGKFFSLSFRQKTGGGGGASRPAPAQRQKTAVKSAQADADDEVPF